MQKIFINDRELAFHREGTGPIILFLHGFPFDHTMYLQVVRLLSPEFDCIVPDLHGFGNSSSSAGETIVTMKQFAEEIAALLDALGITSPIILCGLSMGGYIAMEFARMFPDRLQALLLCDTRTSPDSPEVRQNRYRLAISVTQTGMSPVAESMIPNLLASKTLETSPQTVEFLRQMICSQNPAGTAAAARGMAEREDTTSLLEKMDFIVGFICGSEDKPSPPSVMKEMAYRTPIGRYHEIKDAGHLTPLEQPESYAKIVRSICCRASGGHVEFVDCGD